MINRLGQPPLTSKCLTNAVTSSSDICPGKIQEAQLSGKFSSVAAFQSGTLLRPGAARVKFTAGRRIE